MEIRSKVNALEPSNIPMKIWRPKADKDITNNKIFDHSLLRHTETMQMSNKIVANVKREIIISSSICRPGEKPEKARDIKALNPVNRASGKQRIEIILFNMI